VIDCGKKCSGTDHEAWHAQWQSSHVTTRKRCAASTDASFRILLLLQSILQILNPSKNILGCIMLKEDLLIDAFCGTDRHPFTGGKKHTANTSAPKERPQTKLLESVFKPSQSRLLLIEARTVTSQPSTTLLKSRDVSPTENSPYSRNLPFRLCFYKAKAKHKRLSHIKASRLQQ
jgi:hypothetical protein